MKMRIAAAVLLVALAVTVGAVAGVLSSGRLQFEAVMMPQWRWDPHGSGQVHVQTNCDSATGDRLYFSVTRDSDRTPEVMVHAMAVVPRGCADHPVAPRPAAEAVVDPVEPVIVEAAAIDEGVSLPGRPVFVRRLPEPAARSWR